MNSIATAVSDTATIAGSQFSQILTDSFGVGHTSEMMVEFQRFNEIAYLNSLGAHVGSHAAPILGGYCGGPEGVAVVNVAYHLSCIITMGGSYHVAYPIHYKYGINSTRDTLWPFSISSQAITRNSHFPLLNLTYCAAGPMTEMCFYEIAACTTASVVSGGSIEFGGVSKATNVDYFTPFEPRFASEVAHSVIGMTRKEANKIVNALVKKYEDYFDNPPLGKKYAECWDIHKKMPNKEYYEFYNNIKNEIANMGIPF
jgi:hypothetical protein